MATHYRLLIKGSDVKREVTHISSAWTACWGWTIPFIGFTWLDDQNVCVPSPLGLLPSSYSQSLLLPDVVTWLAPTCDVVNTSSAPTAFRRLCYWLMLVPFSTIHALPRTLHHNILWLSPRSQINHFIPWAAYDCMAFCSMVCQDTSPLLSLLLELLSVWVEYVLAEGVLLKCVANGLHRGINMEMNVHH